jgi:hypothetical protein
MCLRTAFRLAPGRLRKVQVQAEMVVKQLQRIIIVLRSAGPLCHPVCLVVYVVVSFEA